MPSTLLLLLLALLRLHLTYATNPTPFAPLRAVRSSPPPPSPLPPLPPVNIPLTSAPAISLLQRFNCPDFPAPHWIPHTHYPRLYPFCIAFACDCHPDARDPRGTFYRPVCDLLDLFPDVPANLEPLSSAMRVCQNTCGCYVGPASNWDKWPGGPPAVGPAVIAPAEG